MIRIRSLTAAGLVAASALALTACSGAGEAAPTTASSRVAMTYDGGVFVLDGGTLELEADLPLAGFNRLNTAGDDRHVLVSTTSGFEVLDVHTPELTGLVFEASSPGHVVRHGGRTILFADGTGETTVFETDALAGSERPDTRVVPALSAHHGVSIALEDGTLLTTLGDAEGRTGVRVLDPGGAEIARNEQCPAVHGEGTVRGETVVFGCSDGVLIYDDGSFTKLQAEDAYGRSGNMYVTETSSIAVADYNSDPDAEGYLLEELALIDTEAKTTRVLELPIEYTWRGVARTADDGAVILASDGALHLLDPETRELGASYPVIEAWSGPVEWQDTHPALAVVGDIAYVTEPASDAVHTVSLRTGEILATATLPAAPNEIVVVAG